MKTAPRQTRSGKYFSPYDVAPDEAAALVLPGLDLIPLLKQSIADESDSAVDSQPSDVDFLSAQIEDDGSDVESNKLAIHPEVSTCHDNTPNATHSGSLSVQAGPVGHQKGAQKSSHNRRKRKREEEWELYGHDRRTNTVKTVVRASTVVQTELVAADLAAAFGGYGARAGRNRGFGAVVSPSKGLGTGFRLVRADPRKRALVIVEKNGLVVGVLCSPPDQTSYPQAGEAVLNLILREGKAAYFKDDERRHRRGKFPALNFGVTHGNGTTEPINLNNDDHDAMIRRFRASSEVQRVAKFASATFQFWGAGVFKYYHKRLRKLFEKYEHLERIFPASIFPCAAVNFGPRVCAYGHRDHLNCPFGFCAIQPFGHFDFTRGGHEVLWEAELVVELPPNWTLLILSATITHGNTPVSNRETRVSFTQFCPGGLLRFVDNKMRTEAQFQAQDPEGYAKMCEKKATRWEKGVKKLSKYEDVVEEARGLEDNAEAHSCTL